MATNTYQALDKVTVGTATPSITFTGISQGYTDLVVVAVSTNTSAATNMTVQVNGDTGSNYSRTRINGSGTTATSSRNSTETRIYVGDVGNPSVPSVNTLHFMNYSNATTFKTVLGRYGEADIQTGAIVGLWRSTAAITSITINSDSNNFAVGSTFSLYGIKAQVQPGTAKATGGTITYDNFGRVIHTFTASGTFTPTEAITGVEYLVIAGGGGAADAGGGGAGGYRSSASGERSGGGASAETTLTLASGAAQTVTVGAGGNGGFGTNPTNGSNSVFGSITSTGGGAGRYANPNSTGNSGGSGGGGSAVSSNGTGGAGTANQGYAGGGSIYVASYAGGGGGGRSQRHRHCHAARPLCRRAHARDRGRQGLDHRELSHLDHRARGADPGRPSRQRHSQPAACHGHRWRTDDRSRRPGRRRHRRVGCAGRRQ